MTEKLPTTLFRLKKRKLEAILQYLVDHHLVHNKNMFKDNLQTHQLAEYLLSLIYPGYSVSRAKNFAYTNYRECREKEMNSLDPLAYDHVPTTEIFERLDEVFYVDVNWQDERYTPCIEIPISVLKRSIDRVWTDEKQRTVKEGFMHIDISEQIKLCIQGKYRNNSTLDHTKPKLPNCQSIQIQFELENNNEQNISHISICTVMKRTSKELVSQLYMQSVTEFIHKSIYSSPYPLITQQIMIKLLRQQESAEDTFMACMSGTIDDKIEQDEICMIEAVSLRDPTTLKRMRHPIKSIHCKHRSCFDANDFFDYHSNLKLWYCPICFVQIKHLEELKMDYVIKVAVEEYDQEDQVYVIQDGLVVSKSELFITQASSFDDSNYHITKKLRTLTHVT
ncbi:hypothetical protein G6F46_009263 [Rhizopus delemar]|uniref:SP-RING-type domain-containing protein n=3 Tax=Rhizopus TaxID=4842 RepID=I1CFI1_RHIO9|nr:hypothetical protein RO3G_11922 [Rhizopus delemar RA 99-880]KAG1453446.1 hypothetical protein G6F55_008137 [Rhizopus delemar]KAG1539122.1 hypothetical protein G6F51_009333 [Rhizopus arrhizus]KAG1493218.1 hypothetical protein G6F54_008741 [Rhizopus delemar]KAG1507369.1 hypothetical protein G6F53_009000 [Rhizopus delemar]|eukprot:EIE87211.1 hypothetical protein RO3G_11922 [Rhizopus delemar RA 99-880]